MELDRGNAHNQLSAFLHDRREELVATWTERVRELSPCREASKLAIVDHLPEILDRLAADVGSERRLAFTDAPRAHAVDRLGRGFDLREVVREYTILRHCILDLWEGHVGGMIDVHAVRRLHLAIDEAVEESTVRFTAARERVLKALDRISEAALGSDDLPEFLRALLQATLETSGAVDSAVVFLRDGDCLRVRAAVGLEQDLDRGASFAVGEGFAGEVAATRTSKATRDPFGPLRARYGVPLVHRDRCLGVAQIGSATAYEFSDEDMLLFRTMANRATGVIVQAQLVHDLAERELEFRGLADNIAQLAWMADETGSIFWYNRRWFEYTGTTLDDTKGWGWQKVHDPEHLPRVVERFQRAVTRGDDWEDLFPLRGKDGHFRWFLSRAVPIKDPFGRVIRWFGTNTDVTEQRDTEMKLRAAEARLRLATEAAELGTWDIDLITGSAQWSPEMHRIFGVDYQPSPAWPLGRLHPDDRAAVEASLERSYDPSGDGRFVAEYRLRIDDKGHHLWVASRGRTLFDDRGRPARMLGTTIDITARKRAEISASFLSDAMAVLGSSLDYAKTLDEVCRLAVPRVADWAAVTLVERDGSLRLLAVAHTDRSKTGSVTEVLRQHPHDPAGLAGVPAVIRGGRAELVPEISAALLQHAPEGQRRLVRELGLRSYLVVPMVARERVLGAITLASSEGSRVLDEEDLENARHLGRRAALAIDNARLYEDAREATRLREQVLAIVSHDLRSPLSAIQLAASLTAAKLPAADQALQRQVSTIQRAADRMGHLITDLLDVASIQAGRLSIEPRSIAVAKLLDEAIAGQEGAAGKRKIGLRSENAAGPLEVRGDPERLLQVLNNLLGNAIKFCREGDSVLVRAEASPTEVTFSIRDTGPGIPEADLQHIFAPYWSAPRHARKGTGLGLYISRAIVEAHGGRIWAESKVAEGSVFRFTVPIAH